MTSQDRLNATFAALADPTRRGILTTLLAGEASVQQLAAPYAMSLPGISKHLKAEDKTLANNRSKGTRLARESH